MMEIRPIAYYRSQLTTKFGVPRQSGLVPELVGRVLFEPEYANADALRGIEGFDYMWLIWEFSLNGKKEGEWSPLVRPPLLGGNEYMGVFATRSPFRPNALGLSSVRLLGVEQGSDGLALVVAGADLVDGTPIYDIKPYVEYADAHVGVRSGFVDEKRWEKVEVSIPDELRAMFSNDDYAALCKVLELDPRPQYHSDPERVYGMPFAGYDVRFRVSSEGVLEVVEIKDI
ncbi:MAG: tRNA (N6-threonylcarbamoyladenosine(37)-N6)-methyltransferase TrmO [Bacteroidaceae bacterium]|nr:tRNA (N6-threonylcarbamoyladenosine(37)-N6)-methyltransferase TrmO [Bacteroidaceae bacterium]